MLNFPLFEGVCGRATNVILAPSAGCKGFARRSVTSVPAPNSSKLEQTRPVPGSSVSIGRSCRNFACWLPKIGLLLGIFHAPRTENAPYGYERFGAPSKNPPYGYARKKKRKPRQMMASCSPKLHSDPMFYIAFFSPLGPHSGSGAVPRTPALPGYCRGIAGT